MTVVNEGNLGPSRGLINPSAFELRPAPRHNLSDLFWERVVTGLRKKSIYSPSKWAEQYRVMGSPFPGKWSHKHHPWLKGMQDSESPLNIGQKAAQLGYTEAMINIVFYNMDVLGRSCLYALPTKTPDAKDFSSTRFDAALDLSEYIAHMFHDVKNIGLKRAGAASLYIRGSRSRSAFKSIPTGVLIFDEVDEMHQKNVKLAEERGSGQIDVLQWKISTPTVPDYGINAEFNRSSQEHFFFNCPSCSRLIDLQFPRNVKFPDDNAFAISYDEKGETVISESNSNDSNTYICCHECNARLPHETKADWLSTGRWVPKYDKASARGFYVNQLYSATVKPLKFIEKYYISKVDQAAEQEFYNSKLGLPHVVRGAKIDDGMILSARGTYERQMHSQTGKLITMGIDVGTYFHIVVIEWDLTKVPASANAATINHHAKARVLTQFKVTSFADIIREWDNYRVNFCVIDALPERRAVFDFVTSYYGRCRMCYYGNVRGEVLKESTDFALTVDRTAWLDMMVGRFIRCTVTIPTNVDSEYKEQLKAIARVYEKDKTGNLVGKYVSARDDHYAHAQTYAEIALPYAAQSRGQNLTSSPF